MAGLYFHIPFCKRVCAYCDFYKSVDLRRMGPLLESMHRELAARREYLGGEPVRTRYFGGGTPSLCAPEAVAGLLDHAATLFDCTAAEETTLEANPDDLTPAYLAALRRAGVNRLSVGIQSFDDACLKPVSLHISEATTLRKPSRPCGARSAKVMKTSPST